MGRIGPEHLNTRTPGYLDTCATRSAPGPDPLGRMRLIIRGAVQGVGFRPFVYRLAEELGLRGWVSNSAQGVFVEVEGGLPRLEQFRARLHAEKPPRSFIQSMEHVFLDPVGYAGFVIRESEASGEKSALVLPDIATCSDCLREVWDPLNRRYRYPFTNCTHCGPRYSIMESLPYDRPRTTMRGFPMCPACRAEYDDPRDRRFHAQPNACPACGPHLELWDATGHPLQCGDAALRAAAGAVRAGRIVAIKGLGGFHLMVAAGDRDAVLRLRRLKHREEKPLALMVHSPAEAARLAVMSEFEAGLLRSPEAPIVLLRRRAAASGVAPAVAPGNPFLGIMLPYTPLHHLLLAEVGTPVVATSGNRGDEPICTDEREALERLHGIADLFLIHNRPIVRHVDDSLVRVIAGRAMLLRRARGYAPLPITVKSPEFHVTRAEKGVQVFRCSGVQDPSVPSVPSVPPEHLNTPTPEHPNTSTPEPPNPPPILALGAHLKNSVALGRGDDIFLSPHIGDLATAPALEAFGRVIGDLRTLLDAAPSLVAHDAHPEYASTRAAMEMGLPTLAVQHHHAHVLACMAENDLEGPVLGVAWDGTGYGPDGTIWGGEFLRVHGASFTRVAHLRPFRLPGGEAAVREPRRSALGLLYELAGEALFEDASGPAPSAFAPGERAVLRTMLRRGFNAPWTTSAGRLFDAVAALLGLCHRASFEGQAAMALEFAADGVACEEGYPFALTAGSAAEVLDWAPLVRALLADVARAVTVGLVAARFHNTLVEMIIAVARRAGEERVLLTGGCFQNQRLIERAIARLRQEGFRPYWHQRVPPNDGGIALGQVMAARLHLARG